MRGEKPEGLAAGYVAASYPCRSVFDDKATRRVNSAAFSTEEVRVRSMN